MKTYLTYKDDKSDKFWQIETQGNSFTVTYGKTGTAGTSQTKEFDNETTCLKEAEKLVAEKRKKGYEEKSPEQTKSDFKTEWKSICDAENIQEALVKHFNYLADSKGSEILVRAIMQKVISVFTEADQLIINFPNNEKLYCSRPAERLSKRIPKSFERILQKHQNISLSSVMITLGEHGLYDAHWLQESESELLGIVDPEEVISPLWEYSDCWIYHPKEKNQDGEPTIYFLSHEDCNISNPQEYNAGSLFLIRLAKKLDISFAFPTDQSKTTEILVLNGQESAFLKKYAQRTRLADNTILEITRDKLSLFEFNNADIIKISELSNLNLPSVIFSQGSRVQEIDDKIFLHSNYDGTVLLENRDKQLFFIDSWKPHDNIDSSIVFRDRLHYFKESPSRGFHSLSLSNRADSQYYHPLPRGEYIFPKDAIIVDNIVVFVGESQTILFKEEGKSTKEVFRKKISFSSPKIQKIKENNLLIVLETKNVATKAATILEVGKSIKVISSIRPKEYAIVWQLMFPNLWLLTKQTSTNSEKDYFLSNYRWKDTSFELVTEKRLNFKESKGSLFIETLVVTDEEAIFIDREGIFWRINI